MHTDVLLSSRQAIEITAFGTVAAALATAALASLALIAGRRLAEDLEIAREQLRIAQQTLSGSLLPLVSVLFPDNLTTDGPYRLELKNDGQGPAFQITVEVWIFPVRQSVRQIHTRSSSRNEAALRAGAFLIFWCVTAS